jgi:large subunit ribosomal protein L4
VELAEAKTKHMAAFLKALEVQGPALVVVESAAVDVALAARNLPRVEVVEAGNVSVYHLVRYPVVVASRGAMTVLMQRLDGSKRKEGSTAS